MKSQPGTMKNHENRPGTMKNNENPPGTIKKNQEKTNLELYRVVTGDFRRLQGGSDHFSLQNLPIIYRSPASHQEPVQVDGWFGRRLP